MLVSLQLTESPSSQNQVKLSNYIIWLYGIRRNHHHTFSSNSPNTNNNSLTNIYLTKSLGLRGFRKIILVKKEQGPEFFG